MKRLGSSQVAGSRPFCTTTAKLARTCTPGWACACNYALPSSRKESQRTPKGTRGNTGHKGPCTRVPNEFTSLPKCNTSTALSMKRQSKINNVFDIKYKAIHAGSCNRKLPIKECGYAAQESSLSHAEWTISNVSTTVRSDQGSSSYGCATAVSRTNAKHG